MLLIFNNLVINIDIFYLLNLILKGKNKEYLQQYEIYNYLLFLYIIIIFHR